jgi:hypothetical protein
MSSRYSSDSDVHAVALSDWRKLQELADLVRMSEPWKILGDMDIFGISDPETSEMNVVSVLGALGEVYAVHVYLPPEGLAFLRDYFDRDEPSRDLALFKMRRVDVEFVGKKVLSARDIEIRRQLGLERPSVRSKGYALFRSTIPQCAPWYLEPESGRILIQALERCLDFVARIRHGILRLERADGSSDYPDIPVYRRIPGSREEWTLSEEPFPKEDKLLPTKFRSLMEFVDEFSLRRLLGLKEIRTRWECGAFFQTPPVIEGGRPIFPVVALAVDSKSGFIFNLLLHGSRELSPAECVVRSIVKGALEAGFMPSHLAVGIPQSVAALNLLKAVRSELVIEQVSDLPQLRTAIVALTKAFPR